MDFKPYFGSFCKMHLLEDAEVSENLKYHLDQGLNLHENIFRVYSKAYIDLIEEVRRLYEQDKIALDDADADLVESNVCEMAEYNGKKVRLDAPFLVREKLDEATYKGKNVKIGKPFRTPGENKKFAVHVMGPSGRVKKVRFGDPNLSVKNNNPARAKSFRARHKCSEKKDRTTPGYWACRIGSYAKSVGLKSNRSW